MALPGTPVVWSPHGASDTLDASTSFAGSMQSLQNLIPDPSSRDLWQCRPAAVPIVFLALTFPGATFISAVLNVGTRIYGMVNQTTIPGRDVPFCYDVPTNTFIPITGTNANNTPASPLPNGVWVPPSMALVGSKIIVSHPGFTGAGGAFFGVIDTTIPFALTWTATNTAPVALVAPPSWVVNFNGRCFFLVNPPTQQPAAYMSDSLNPTVITNANQILTFGDNTSLTVAAGLALSNQLGGIIQALMIFKGVTNIYQVTGDYALQNLSINSLNVATGTLAPNSVVSSEKGLLFMAPDGVRLIDFNATVSDPIGKDGNGITVPFFFALTPSRVNAMFNGGIYRIQVQNAAVPGAPQQEWWYDFVREIWSGPHTTKQSLGTPYQKTFFLTIQGAGAVIFQSDQVQSVTSTFVENGVALSYNWWTSFLPDTDQMAELAMIETTIYMALVPGGLVMVGAVEPGGNGLDNVVIQAAGTPTIWGNFNWGAANWGGSGGVRNALFPRRLPWHYPIVFRRVSFQATGLSAGGLKLGRMHMKYEILGYLQEDYTNSVVIPSPFVLDVSTLGGPDVL